VNETAGGDDSSAGATGPAHDRADALMCTAPPLRGCPHHPCGGVQGAVRAVSNHPKPGNTTAMVTERHGRRGHVSLTTSVPPELKTHLVELCQHRGVTLKDAIQQALEQFLYEVHP
jgi:hypothetical protein